MVQRRVFTHTAVVPSSETSRPTLVLPIVAIVGRPNVGKSTLFNRLVGERRAITSDTPGTTRDRITAEVTWNRRPFTLMDTGGLDAAGAKGVIDPQVVEHALGALPEADLILFVIDARADVTALDRQVAEHLRRSRKPVLLVANKAERTDETQAAEFYSLGFGDPALVSAQHGRGTGDLLDAVVSRLAPSEARLPDDAVRIALVGRPNVGKSSLLNAFADAKIAIVSEVPGTTRDPIDTDILYKERHIRLIDTAGIRRAGKITEELDRFAVERAVRAVERSDVAVLILDAMDHISHQDQVICSVAIDGGTGLVLCVNKWDLVEDPEAAAEGLLGRLHKEFVFLPWVSVVFTSATTKQNLSVILDRALEAADARAKVIDPAELSAFIKKVSLTTPPPPGRKGPTKIVSATQVRDKPPAFQFVLHGAETVHFSYKRFLERQLREKFGFGGTPLKLTFVGDR